LFDDIATILDDVSTLTSVATQKTAGVLGDDLALNAQQLIGLSADRELPVVWAVAKGSSKNKLILVPAALALSFFARVAIQPLLMIGGLFLCYEGVEKLAHKYLHSPEENEEHHQELIKAISDESIDMVAMEKKKIAGAIRTDFVLSAEIITLTLATVAKAQATFAIQVAVLCVVAVLMTVGVYGLVAIIVKLDDVGLFLTLKKGTGGWRSIQRMLGRLILASAPYLLRTLSIAGTIAMFVVGGGILTHGIHALHESIHAVAEKIAHTPWIGGLLYYITGPTLDGVVGVIAGAIVLLIVLLAKRIWKSTQS